MPGFCNFPILTLSNKYNYASLIAASIAAMLLTPSESRSDCSVEPSRFQSPFSDKVVAARNQFFSSMCGGDKGELFDLFYDPSLKGRIEPPSAGVNDHKGNYYPDIARRANHSGKTTVAFIIESDGYVSEISVIESSGYPDLDQGAVDAYKQLHFERPAKLDGNAVRVIVYKSIQWRVEK